MDIISNYGDFYIVENVFSKKQLSTISKIYSKIEKYSLWNRSIKHPGRRELNGARINKKSPLFYDHQELIRSEDWVDILELIRISLQKNKRRDLLNNSTGKISLPDYEYYDNRESIILKLRNKFFRILYKILKKIKNKKNSLLDFKQDWFFDITYNSANLGYTVNNHKDQRHKLFAGVIYLVSPPLGKEKEGSFLINNPNGKPIKEVFIKKNCGVLFLNNNMSFHSTTDFSEWGYDRKFIYFSFACKSFFNIWD